MVDWFGLLLDRREGGEGTSSNRHIDFSELGAGQTQQSW